MAMDGQTHPQREKVAQVLALMKDQGFSRAQACAQVGVTNSVYFYWKKKITSGRKAEPKRQATTYEAMDSRPTPPQPAKGPAATSDKFMVLLVDKNQLMGLINGGVVK